MRGCRPHSQLARDIRSEEHTSELQSQSNLVCRLLLEIQDQAEDKPKRSKDDYIPLVLFLLALLIDSGIAAQQANEICGPASRRVAGLLDVHRHPHDTE